MLAALSSETVYCVVYVWQNQMEDSKNTNWDVSSAVILQIHGIYFYKSMRSIFMAFLEYQLSHKTQ